jgi:hypothetical protein
VQRAVNTNGFVYMEEAVSAAQEAITANPRKTARHLVQQTEVSTSTEWKTCHDDGTMRWYTFAREDGKLLEGISRNLNVTWFST